MSFKDIGFSKVDLNRQNIKGFPEIVYGLHKSPEQILKISQTLVENHENLLVTRFSEDKWKQIKKEMPIGEYDPIGETFVVGGNKELKHGKVMILSAGTSDDFVVYEAANTLKWMGCSVDILQDVGVAGIGRLLSYVEQIREASVIIVVAGMEGALPSVVSGLVDVPVIAVPTSVGYGANLEGVTTVLAMLTSCSSGISVVNIDNGFGAAYQAALMIKLLNK